MKSVVPQKYNYKTSEWVDICHAFLIEKLSDALQYALDYKNQYYCPTRVVERRDRVVATYPMSA